MVVEGDLKIQFEKNGKNLEKLNPDRSYISRDGKGLKLHGRSLLLIRNVGHLMTNPSILLKMLVRFLKELWMHLLPLLQHFMI